MLRIIKTVVSSGRKYAIKEVIRKYNFWRLMLVNKNMICACREGPENSK
jgi:hypothetical protein